MHWEEGGEGWRGGWDTTIDPYIYGNSHAFPFNVAVHSKLESEVYISQYAFFV